MMQEQKEFNKKETIGEIVVRDYQKAVVFKKRGIDYSCEGLKTVKEACEQLGLSEVEIEEELKNTPTPTGTQPMDFQNWESGFLCKYLIQLHHQYVKTQTGFIQELGQKVARANITKYPEIDEIVEVFVKAGTLLEQNSTKQERAFFPYIISLSDAHKNGSHIKAADFGKLSAPILLMETEHKAVSQCFYEIKKLTNGYTLPAYPSNAHSIFFKMLGEYEDDLHFHLHLENNILFPKVLQLEADMRFKNRIVE